MIESVEHIKPILALNTLVMVLFTMALAAFPDIALWLPRYLSS